MLGRERSKSGRERREVGRTGPPGARPCRVRRTSNRRVDDQRARSLKSWFPDVPVSSRGQDTWFSATGPGFESPYRYQRSNSLLSVSSVSKSRIMRGAKGNIVAPCCFHDSPDRVHNDVRLINRHDVTGLLSDHQTSSF